MKPTLELDDLSVGYGRRVLLKDLCASILPGQILTLIGPNGAGKSTILKTISHHLACMGGVVRIGGEILSGWTATSWQSGFPSC